MFADLGSVLGEDATSLGVAGSSTLISGQLRSPNDEPLAGIPVEIAGQIAVTDAYGYFQIAIPWSAQPTDSLDISVPTGDPYFDPFGTGVATIPMQRARFDATTGDQVGDPMEHPNLITSFLDAGMVYGSDDERAAALRTFVDGKLKTSAGELMPVNDLATFPTGTQDNDNAGPFDASLLFVGGDVRANENVALTSLHTLLVREHNRLADQIKAENPTFTDEQIYQQARRLVGAIVQQITYNEYLPILIGLDALPAYAGYDDAIDPSESAIFATAAYRVGHTQLYSEILRLDENLQSLPGGSLELRHAFFNPQAIYDDGIEPYLRGLLVSQSEEIDTYVIDDVRNFLFGPPGAGGLDLAAINIQRGRDLGLPSYNQARIDFGLPAVTAFSEITSDPVVAMRLEQAYGSVDKIDVWVGGMAEDHVPGAQVGPLFQKIIADQFARVRDGDRYYFENGQFTADEMTLIRSTRLSSLIERNTGITGLPDNVFLSSGIGAIPGDPYALATEVSTDYRSADGFGNNVANPTSGAANDNLTTNFTVSYGDGYFSPAGDDRPNTREISNTVIAQAAPIPNSAGTTGFFVFWGQLLDHDLGLTPGGVSNELNMHGETYLDPVTNVTYELTSGKVNVLLGHEVFAGAGNVILDPIYVNQDVSESKGVFAHFSGEIATPGATQTFIVSISPDHFDMPADWIAVGWKVTAVDGSSLDPAAVQILTAQGMPISTGVAWNNVPTGGGESLVMSRLNPGNYRIVVAGEGLTTGGFILQAVLAGDTSGDRFVDVFDMFSVFNHVLGSLPPGDPADYYVPEADLNADGLLTQADYEIAVDNIWNGTSLNPLYLSLMVDPADDTGAKGDGVTSIPLIQLCGAATPGSLVTFDLNGDGVIDDQMIAVESQNGVNYVFDALLSEGSQQVVVKATDPFGQTLTRKLMLTLDSIAPSVVSVFPEPGGLIISSNTSDFTVQIQFNENLPLDDVLAKLLISGNVSGTITPLSPRWDSTTHTLSFEIDGAQSDTNYIIEIPSTLTDQAGNPTGPLTYTFQRVLLARPSTLGVILLSGIEVTQLGNGTLFADSLNAPLVLSLIDLVE